jgi:hypothetical protein
MRNWIRFTQVSINFNKQITNFDNEDIRLHDINKIFRSTFY